MFADHDRFGRAVRAPWLLLAAVAAGLVVSGAPARAQGGGTAAAPDIQAGNDSLLAERLLSQFYNLNAGKAYLTGVSAVNPAPGTSPPAVIYPPGSTPMPGSGNGTLLTATLTGNDVTPAVSNSASGSASLFLSRDQTVMSYQVTFTGLSSAVEAIRIRQGPSGPNGIILYILSPPDNGVSSGSVGVRPEDVAKLVGGQTFVEITTQLHPGGEIRGQLHLASGTQPPVVTPPVVNPTPGGGVPAGVNQVALLSIVSEIKAGHNAHVAMLQQLLGANAAPLPTFQNLDAPTLTQFLTIAQALEDFAVGAAQNGTVSVLAAQEATAPGAAPLTVNQPLVDVVTAIVADDGRYAGGIRAFEKISSTALGGNPNITLSENGQPFNIPRSRAQIAAFLQIYLAPAGTAPTGTAPTPPAGAAGGAY